MDSELQVLIDARDSINKAIAKLTPQKSLPESVKKFIVDNNLPDEIKSIFTEFPTARYRNKCVEIDCSDKYVCAIEFDSGHAKYLHIRMLFYDDNICTWYVPDCDLCDLIEFALSHAPSLINYTNTMANWNSITKRYSIDKSFTPKIGK